MKSWRIVLVGIGAVLVLCAAGCASMTTKNVEAFANLVDRMDARGSGTLHDPSFEAYVYHESGVGVRLKGVHAQGAGQGAPPVEDE